MAHKAVIIHSWNDTIMRTSSFAAPLLLILGTIWISCTPVVSPTESRLTQTGKLGAMSRLSHSYTLIINEEQLEIRFDSVSEDSRCPENADCIWAGNARVHCTLTKSSVPKQHIMLNTLAAPQSAVYQGYTILLRELTPLPKAGEITPQSAYKAGLIITK